MNDLLDFNIESACRKIADFIENKRVSLNRDGIIIGLSGGLDSAVVAYLCILQTEKEKVKLLYLPDKDSKNLHHKDAIMISNDLGVPLQVQDITPILAASGIYGLTPLRYVPGRTLKYLLTQWGKKILNLGHLDILSARLSPKPNSIISKANAYGMIKHRVRMMVLTLHAEIHNLLVVGAANKTELMTGMFTQWGCDQCADVMPVIHLYRSQLELIAEHLKIPSLIRSKPADPDIIPGLDDKGELIGSFQVADQILWGLEHGVPSVELGDRFGRDHVSYIINLVDASSFMREVPYRMF